MMPSSRTRSLLQGLLVAVPLVLAPRLALAQEDPGLDLAPATPPPATSRPATQPAPTTRPQPTTTPSTTTTTTPPATAAPTELGAPVHEDVQEEVSSSPTETLTDDEWEMRLAAPTLSGPVGLFRTMSADVGLPLNFRVSSHIQAFTQNSFLIAGSGTTAGDKDSRFLGDLLIGLTGPDVTVLRGIEIYLAIYNSSNENVRRDPGRTDPSVILALGDVGVGLHGGWEVSKGISVGGNAGVRFFNSISDVTANFGATSATFDLIGTLDVRKFVPKVPLRFHLNAGFLLDNSLNVLPAGQCGNSMSVDACIRSRVVETFAYGLGVSRLRFALAAELPLRPHVPWGIFGVDLFVEYHLENAVGDGDKTVEGALNKAGIERSRVENTLIQYITAGIRLRPVARLVVDIGSDFGIQSPGFRYGPPLPVYNIIVGATYTYDPTGSNTKVIKRTITRTYEAEKPPAEGHVKGLVRDAKTKAPIAGAIVTYAGRTVSPQVTAADGSFTSYGFGAGPVKLEVAKDEYDATATQVNVDAGHDTAVELLLTPHPREGKVHVKAVDEKGAVIAGASARLVGAVLREATVQGTELQATAPAGEFTVIVEAPGYLAKEHPVTVVASGDSAVTVTLRKRPAQSHVTVTKDQIVIKGTIHFGTNTATILPDGQQILDEVADVLTSNQQIRKVAIEGHTDNRGGADKNLKLSKDRANAVMAYLVKQGISPERLTAEGYGATRPIVPNLTAANRAKNRRVDFKIIEQTGGGGATQ